MVSSFGFALAPRGCTVLEEYAILDLVEDVRLSVEYGRCRQGGVIQRGEGKVGPSTLKLPFLAL